MPAVISFDIWNTILASDRPPSGGLAPYTVARMEAVKEYFTLEVDLDKLCQAYLVMNRAADTEMDETGREIGATERLNRIADMLELGRTFDYLSVLGLQSRLAWLRRQPEYLPRLIEPGLVDTLDDLRSSGYRIALLSNTGFDSGTTMRPLLEKLGILDFTDYQLFSSDERIAKPSKLIFERLAAHFEVGTAELLHVGDNLVADYRGALDAGCEALLFHPDGPNPEVPQAAQIGRLGDLPARLREWDHLPVSR